MLDKEQLEKIKNTFCQCKDCKGACDNVLKDAGDVAHDNVVHWIRRNTIWSHEPAMEHIVIRRHEWNSLLKGEIPPERERTTFA